MTDFATAVDVLRDLRTWKTNGQVTTVSLPWADYPNGQTIGWMGCTAEGWTVRIYCGPFKGWYPAANEAAARKLLDRHTAGVVLR